LAGIWEGILDVGATELRIVVNLEHHDAGSLSGYMTSPDQSSAEIPVTRVDLLDGDKVRIAVGSASISFEMALSDDGNQLSGSFIQGRGKFDISLDKKEKISEVRRLQEPKPPFPYRAEEVSYDNEEAGVTFAGTLTIPEGDGPFPSVLMITGSGGQDRDETIFQHRPFFVIADHLSRRAIAVLRVDDRGVGGTTADDEPEKATTEDFVGDALCGVEFLKGRSEIAADRIGLIGHSEGGVIAPLVALRSDDVAFIVMMAGTGIRGDHLLLRQNELIARVSEVEEEKIKEGLELSQKMFAVVLEDSLDEEQMRSRLEAILRESPNLTEEGEEAETAIASTIDQLMLPWVRWFLRYDPAPTLEKITCPVLAINGALDLQVPCKENLAAIEAALIRGKNSDFEMVEFPRLNHLFQHCETGAPSEYGQIEETFSVDVLEKMTNWILHRFGNNKERKVSD
ncbi:MAG: alpha/beta fold hydrolase, partial [Planctomycetota bacterium]